MSLKSPSLKQLACDSSTAVPSRLQTPLLDLPSLLCSSHPAPKGPTGQGPWPSRSTLRLSSAWCSVKMMCSNNDSRLISLAAPVDPSCAFKYFIPEPEDPGKHKQKASRAVPSWAARSTHALRRPGWHGCSQGLGLAPPASSPLCHALRVSSLACFCDGRSCPGEAKGRTAASAGPSFRLLSRGLPLGWVSCWPRENRTREGKPRAGLARVGPGRGSLVLASREPNPGEVGLVLVSREPDLREEGLVLALRELDSGEVNYRKPAGQSSAILCSEPLVDLGSPAPKKQTPVL